MTAKPYLFVALIACALIVCATPASAGAYYLETRGETTDPIRWSDSDSTSADIIDVEYRINTSSFPADVSGVEEAIHAAFMTWSDADCANVEFTAGDVSTSTTLDHWASDGDARYILVYFTDSDEEWASGPSVGHFYWGFNPSGEVLGGSVILNSRDHAWATDGAAGALDVQGVVTALVGRSMGITSVMEGNATYPSYSPGDTSKRTLGGDDLAALQYLYLESGCATPAEPEAICPAIDPIGGEPCPPPVSTMPGDGGTLPQTDAGMSGAPDAGISSADAGMGGVDDGGCGCHAAGSRTRSGAASVIALVLAFAMIGRRRR